MKPLLIAACIAGFSLVAGASPGQSTCRTRVPESVVVAPGEEFSLADLLTSGSGSCAALRHAAASVPLGRAPLAGSARVLAGSEVRMVLHKLAEDMGQDAGEFASILVPERITVRRAGARASCADIGRRLAAAAPGAVDCGAANRISADAPLEFTQPAWDPALGSWELCARCVDPADCVPFLVRLRGSDPQAETGTPFGGVRSEMVRSKMARSTIARLAATSFRQAASGPARALPMVRPGQTVILLWDQDGIRLVVPVVCLDPGAPGERVRARMVHGGALLHAIVVGAGMLRAAS